MKTIALSNMSVPANSPTVGALSEGAADSPSYKLSSYSVPANAQIGPTVTTADPVTARRRPLILMAS